MLPVNVGPFFNLGSGGSTATKKIVNNLVNAQEKPSSCQSTLSELAQLTK